MAQLPVLTRKRFQNLSPRTSLQLSKQQQMKVWESSQGQESREAEEEPSDQHPPLEDQRTCPEETHDGATGGDGGDSGNAGNGGGEWGQKDLTLAKSQARARQCLQECLHPAADPSKPLLEHKRTMNNVTENFPSNC